MQTEVIGVDGTIKYAQLTESFTLIYTLFRGNSYSGPKNFY